MSRRRRKRANVIYFGKRRRQILNRHPTSIMCGTSYYTSNGGRSWIKISDAIYKPGDTGRIYSDGFGLGDETHPGPPYRSGGPFSKFTFSDPLAVIGSGDRITMITSQVGYRYVGGFVPVARCHDFYAPFSSVNLADEVGDGVSAISRLGDISSYGATGWNRFRPGNPTADLGVFLGELRDVPRMLSGTAKFFHNLWRSMGGSLTAFKPTNVADAWLNTQFGWRPFISDLRKFYRTYQRLDEMLNRIRRDNGKWIRRGGTVQTSSDVVDVYSSDTITGHWPILTTYHYQSAQATGSQKRRLIKSQRVWFEGRFRYWIPSIDSPQWRYRAIAELYGAMPCPSLIWNLIPWSWLVDWCSNVGDVISNLSTGYADNLAAKYAYIMGTTEWEGRFDSSATLKMSPLHNTWTYPFEWKSRVAASPFGFGLSSEDFTARQLSILAALGVSRLTLR